MTLALRPRIHQTGEVRTRDVLSLAGPSIAQYLLVSVVFIVDRAMLGRHSPEALAAMQVAGPLWWFSESVFGAFTVGTIAVVGRAVGAGDPRFASAAARASFCLALALGIGAALLGTALMPAIPYLFEGAGEAVLAQAKGYLSVFFPGIPLLLLSMTAGCVFIASGNTRTPFIVNIAGNLINVFVNWVLIFGNLGAPEMGARGAAIATLVAMSTEGIVLIALLARPASKLPLRMTGSLRPALKRVVRVSFPAMLERLSQQVGYFGFVLMLTTLGPVAMAANQALISIESIAFLSAEGFGVASATLAAQSLGAGDQARARAAVARASFLGALGLGLAGLVFLLAPRVWLAVFSTDAAVIDAGEPCMLFAAVIEPAIGLSVGLVAGFRGAGATRHGLVVTLAGGLVVRLLSAALLVFVFDYGLLGMWIATGCDWLVRVVLAYSFFIRGGWLRYEA